MRNKKIKIFVSLLIVFIIFVSLAFDKRLKTVEYTIESNKITNEVRLALITDLHSCYYGDGQSELFEKIADYNPDAVLLGGDIFDDIMDSTNARVFVSKSAEKHKTYYVSGNHEWWSDRMYEFFGYLNECGVTVLRGDCDELDVSGEKINICGIDDPEVGRYDTSFPTWEEQLKSSLADATKENFTLLLAHRPENAEMYFKHDIDLALCGHAHGGQFRIPFVLNGFYAPNQGFFPKLAGGMYDFNGKTLVVSRGLSDENSRLPRIFNRPELVFITVKTAK